MPPHALPYPSGRELEVMHVLWELEDGDIKEILAMFNDLYPPPVSYFTMATMLRRLYRKRYVHVEVRRGRNRYVPGIERERARNDAIDRVIDEWFGHDLLALVHIMQERLDQRAARIARRQKLAAQRRAGGT